MEIKVIPKEEFPKVLEILRESGYRVIAPVLRGGVVLLDEVSSFSELALGVREEQEKGYYRVKEGGEEWFGYVHGPDSPKRFLHPPRQELLRVKEDLSQEVREKRERYAFFGLRGCDVTAIRILDRVFLGGEFPDTHYRNLREGAFVIGVNCLRP
jgi:hypothetical protein